jgi:hypothetical protein
MFLRIVTPDSLRQHADTLFDVRVNVKSIPEEILTVSGVGKYVSRSRFPAQKPQLSNQKLKIPNVY